MEPVKLKVKRLRDTALIPTKNKNDDAAFDLYWCPSDPAKMSMTVDTWAMLETGVSFETPKGYYLQIQGRSGLAAKFGVDVLGGVIDSGYRGEVKVIVSCPYGVNAHFNRGDRIGQLIMHKLPEVELVEVAELSDSERGENGFGSSGR